MHNKYQKDIVLSQTKQEEDNGLSLVKHLMEFEEVALETIFVNYEGKVSMWGQEVQFSADGNRARIILWANPFTSTRLRKMADLLDQAAEEVNKLQLADASVKRN